MRPLLSLALLAIAEPIAAQHGGFIAGVVRDRSGGVVPGAEIRLQNDATGARQKVYCDADGKYFTSELVQGAYKITVRNEGFRTITQSGVGVKAGEMRLIDFVIDVLPLQQEVTVEADRGRALNPAAFQVPAAGTNGTLGRNVLTGVGLFQIDASLRRQFRLYRGSSLEASVSAFSALNHPAFSNPMSYLSSPLFGQPTSMANLMLGSGSPTTGLTPIFQAGGPRTVELGLRFTF